MRAPLKRWPSVSRDILMEKRYKADHPPFGPFPTVTNVVNAAICPVACVHDLLYGIDDAVMTGNGFGAGELFHGYVAALKTSRASGKCMPGGERRFYDEFAEKRYDAAKDSAWIYVRHWLERKRDELSNLDSNLSSYFEVHVANDSMRIGGGHCSYPLSGRIDELDTGHKVLIERTILGSEEDPAPPGLKGFQAWILWKLLCSVEKTERPVTWRNENFDEYDVVVETPYRDFTIKKDNHEYEAMAHDAYCWIHDISSQRFKQAIYEAWQSATCSYDERNPACGLADRYCYRKRMKYPQGRGVMHADMRRFYISLFNEQMWSHHLLMYQLMKLPLEDLAGWKIVRGTVEKSNEGVVIAVDGDTRALQEKSEEGEYAKDVTVIFGSLKLGLVRKAESKTLDDKRLKLKVRGRELPGSVNILLPEAALVTEEPWFLRRLMQKQAYSFGLWGLDNDARASRHAVIQLLDSVFWGKRLVMSKPENERKG
jgi:hypothetical protein